MDIADSFFMQLQNFEIIEEDVDEVIELLQRPLDVKSPISKEFCDILIQELPTYQDNIVIYVANKIINNPRIFENIIDPNNFTFMIQGENSLISTYDHFFEPF